MIPFFHDLVYDKGSFVLFLMVFGTATALGVFAWVTKP
jgi:hypothetical protein